MNPHRSAKIVCTIGPAVDSDEAIVRLIEAGMNVARLNFSHGTHDEHRERVQRVRKQSQRLGKPVAILQDLSGPKVRTHPGGPEELQTGGEVILKGTESDNPNVLAVDYERLHLDLKPDDAVLLADGHIGLRVTKIEGELVHCAIEHGGALRPRAGVNLPSHRVQLPALTDKDRDDLRVGIEQDVDYLALSYVREASDVISLKELCATLGRPIPVIAKIETPGAVERIEAIIEASDGVMVARGDLGVELPPEQVPVIQKQIIGTASLLHKPVIVATEMLHSMIESPRPTRAEASDCAGAVFGSADALMLSGETATGRFAHEACRMMARIICQAEQSPFFRPIVPEGSSGTAGAVAKAACDIAHAVGAKAVVALTESGNTARLVSKARPSVPIVAFSPQERTVTRASLLWGVASSQLPRSKDFRETVVEINKYLLQAKLVGRGESYVLVYGAIVGATVTGSTNAIRIEQVE